MRIENDPKLDFRDVLIRPKRSTLGSRAHVDVERSFRFPHTGKDWKGFPLIAANMDVVGTMAMARALLSLDRNEGVRAVKARLAKSESVLRVRLTALLQQS